MGTSRGLVTTFSDVIHPVDVKVAVRPGELMREAIAAYQPFATVIGKRLGELHAVLASPTDDPAFTPELVEAGEAMAWATATGEEVDRALQTLENFTAWRDDSEHEAAKELIALRRPLPLWVGR